MTGFTDLELAALRSIFAETPQWEAALTEQLAHASVAKRENSGRGFFTDIAVSDDVPALTCPDVLAYETHARVEGLEHGMGFVLFMKGGKLQMLEGYALSSEDTAALDLGNLTFEIFKAKVHRS